MAFVANDPNQPQQQNQINPMTQQAPITTSSAPGSGPGGQGKSTAQNTPAQPFTNLQSYLTANAPQIQSQADKISGDLMNQYGQVMQGLNQGAQDFGTQVSQGYAAPNTDLVNQAASNPAQFASNPNNVKAFQAQYNDTYGGPANYEGSDIYQTQNKAVQDAASKAGLVNTLPGLQTYFQSQNPTQTQGQNTLDTAILRASPTALAQVENAAQPFSTLQDYLSGQVTAQDKAVQDAIASANANRTAVQNQFTGQNGVIPTFQNTLSQNLTNAQNKAGVDEKNLVARLLNAAATGQDLKDIGLSPQDYASLMADERATSAAGNKVDLNPYFLQGVPTTDITAANNATPQDYANAAALQLLIGSDMTGILNPANASQGGTAPTNLVSLSGTEPEDIKSLNATANADDTSLLQSLGIIPASGGSKVSIVPSSPQKTFFYADSNNPGKFAFDQNSLLNAINGGNGTGQIYSPSWFQSNGGLDSYLNTLGALARQNLLSPFHGDVYNQWLSSGIINPVTGGLGSTYNPPIQTNV